MRMFDGNVEIIIQFLATEQEIDLKPDRDEMLGLI